MSVCDNISQCPVFQKRKTVEEFSALSHRYCIMNCEQCQRRIIRLEKGMEAVPVDLLPDGSKFKGSIWEVE